MAEGFARFLGPNDVEVFSAGTAPTKPNPMAIKAMKEVGVDISQHQAKGMRDIPLGRVALAITMSFEGEEPLRLPENLETHHWPLEDPIDGAEDDILENCRYVRDQIRQLVSSIF